MHNEGKEIKRVASLKHGTHLSMSNRILTNTIRAVGRVQNAFSSSSIDVSSRASEIGCEMKNKRGGGGQEEGGRRNCVTETKGGGVTVERKGGGNKGWIVNCLIPSDWLGYF